MKWCAARGYVIASPLPVVDALLPTQPGKAERVEHQPALPWRNIPEFVENVLLSKPQNHLLPSLGKRALLFLLLTAARSGEVRGMTWSEIDFDSATWTIPRERMKANRRHRVPLSHQAISILQQQWELLDRRKKHQDDSLVFPSARGSQISDMTLTKILRDHDVPSDVPGRAATAHGMRSSFRDWASEQGFARELCERAIAHTIRNPTEAAYHRTDLLEERRSMMTDWADHCVGRQSG
ncbi:tyrosine-type recombinase/integrase [Pseudahrensia aquimaris]|uniref:Tyrosine-type recombinase/integrase n=1 Tax=Pseudahrensia aquimaris TaxID=744461 RepID=A0ABW3FF36_9HYPH